MLLRSWPRCPECNDPLLAEIKEDAKDYSDTEMVCYGKRCSQSKADNTEEDRLNRLIEVVKKA